MKSYRKELWFEAPERMHFTNITSDIKSCLTESDISEGFVLLMQCILLQVFLLMTMSLDFIMTTKNG